LNSRQISSGILSSRPTKLFLDTPILALVLTLLTYLRCVGNQFVFDDIDMIVGNDYIARWSMVWKSFVSDSWWFLDPLNPPHSAYYRPLQDVWLSLNYHLFGFAPAGWHLSIVAVHLVVVWLVFEIARDLSASRWTPAVAATLFGLMPIHAQAVVWPAAIPLPMSAAFELLALHYFIHSDHPLDRGSLVSILFYGLSLLSHESAAAFPLILVAYDLILARERDPQRRHGTSFGKTVVRAAVRSWPFFALLAGYLMSRFLVLGSEAFGARREMLTPMTLAQHVLTLPEVLALYLQMLVIPWKAAPSHPMAVVPGITSQAFYLPLLLIAGVALVAVALLRQSPHRMLYLFCAAWIGIALLPMLNLQVLTIEDRYLYMSSVAWCVMVADLALLGFAAASLPIAMAVTAAGAVAILEAAFLFHVEKFWHDNFTLYSECARLAPDSWYYHDRLAGELFERKDFAGAEREYVTSLRQNPKGAIAFLDLATVRGNLGKTAEAVEDLRHAFILLASYKSTPAFYVQFATTAHLLGAGDLRDAAFKRALDLHGGADAVDIGRATLMLDQGDLYKAQDCLQSALARSPDNAKAWALLGATLAREGKPLAAINAYKQALTLEPSPKVGVAIEDAVSRLSKNRSSN
jgi:protein O-mannosyl-transferase